MSTNIPQPLKPALTFEQQIERLKTVHNLTIFLKTVARERRIPFEITADPFYSEYNIRYLEQKMAAYKTGTLQTSEHSLIEK